MLTGFSAFEVSMAGAINVKHDNEMLALAEAVSTTEEVVALVLPLIARAFRRAKKTHTPIGQARSMMWLEVTRFLNEHYYVLPQQEATINGWSKNYLKGYQRWWWKVEKKRKKIERLNEQKGRSGNARAEALRSISPELYETA
jgi:hypothetical protein